MVHDAALAIETNPGTPPIAWNWYTDRHFPRAAQRLAFFRASAREVRSDLANSGKRLDQELFDLHCEHLIVVPIGRRRRLG